MTTYTSDQRRHTSETAETMADVRYEIDRIDRLLVEILAERQSFMDAAARIKPDRSKVYDADRIEDVVAKVKAACQGAGLSPAIAEPVWRKLIERCIAYEFRKLRHSARRRRIVVEKLRDFFQRITQHILDFSQHDSCCRNAWRGV